MTHKLKFPPRALGARFVGLPADNPFIGASSAARLLMVTRQKDQYMSLTKPTISCFQSGLEKDMYRHTYKVEIPVDAEILDVIPITPHNPWRRVVFYKCVKTGQLGHVELRTYHSGDGKHGFEYVPTDDLDDVLRGSGFVNANTPLLEVASSLYVDEHNYGVELNTCICSMVESAEDGVVVSDAAIRKLGFKNLITRNISVKYNQEPISIGGDVNDRYVVPTPGMTVGDDGILMAVRQLDDQTGVILAHTHHLNTVNHDLDTVYQIHGGGGKVVDLWVVKSGATSHIHHNEQLDHLANMCHEYQLNYIRSYRRLRHRTSGIFPETENFITQAILIAEHARAPKEALKLHMNKSPLPPYHIEIAISQPATPNLAAKVSDKFSAKGVIVRIVKEEDMPIDQYGKRAEVVVPREAGTNRNIIGRDYGQLVATCIHTCTDMLVAMVGLSGREPVYRKAVSRIKQLPQATKDQMLDLLDELYCITNRIQTTALRKYRNDLEEMDLLLIDAIHRGVVVALPLDVVCAGNRGETDHALPLGPIPILEDLMASKFYRPPGPISYVLFDGTPITTVEPIAIGPIYYVLLDKLGQESNATYTTSLQVRGLSARMNKTKKDTAPLSRSNIKVLGNDECIILSAVVGPHAMAKHIRDLSDPVYNAKSIQRVLNTGELYPDIGIDEVPVGANPGRQLIMHVLNAAGIELYYNKC